MRAFSPAAGKIVSVEWNKSVAEVRSLLLPAAAHFVLPDLPGVVSDRDREAFETGTGDDPSSRIHTVAACHHETAESLLAAVDGVHPDARLLVVGGDQNRNQTTNPRCRGPSALSALDAAKILSSERGNELWGVADPNDPSSPERLLRKTEAGMAGFLTQPLLSSPASDTLADCREAGGRATKLLAGLALPRTARGLRFWAGLLGREDELERDPLFASHLAYFSQPYVTPLAWAGRELTDLLGNPDADGVHFMPLSNTGDLCALFESLNHVRRAGSSE
ncbi:unnamed protein product [Pseudo-nitzschia multistriata]|uniref:Methylenetetrahydrofolate reductase (NAD(P)H) n=1 Tax=Pseudo-nitzschia multistriata TaxID=183589 RepID=A0A448Z129_9STRA|nr:unnamed protein product [Pseudo-nitzschia multistriata]